MSLQLLVMGASRGIGREVTRKALARGIRVRGFARSEMVRTEPGFEGYQGDALDQGAVESALEGVDVVVQCLGVPFDRRLFTGPITLFSEATQILLRAMANGSCKRLIAVTGFGAGESKQSISLLQRPGFALVFGRAYADKSKQETLIQQSALEWTMVRPGVLTDGEASAELDVLVEPDSWRNGVVSRASVAKFIVQQCQQPTLVGKAPVLANRFWPISGVFPGYPRI